MKEPQAGVQRRGSTVHESHLKESYVASYHFVSWWVWLSHQFSESCEALDLSPQMIMAMEYDSGKDNSYARAVTLSGWWLSQEWMCSHSTQNIYKYPKKQGSMARVYGRLGYLGLSLWLGLQMRFNCRDSDSKVEVKPISRYLGAVEWETHVYLCWFVHLRSGRRSKEPFKKVLLKKGQ